MSQIELTDIDDARSEVADLTAVLQEQIELLKMAQEAIKLEMRTDLEGKNPVLHRDVAAKLNGITRSMAEAGRVTVTIAKAHKELAGSMTPEERIKATARYLMTLPNTVLNALLTDVLRDRKAAAEKASKERKQTGPRAAVEVLAAAVGSAPRPQSEEDDDVPATDD